MDRKKILLVDDDASLLRLLSLRLNAAGYSVRTASGGREALGKIETLPPDLVITDLKMGQMDGLDLFERIQKNFPSIPVIILTAHGTISGAVDATRKGLFCYISKPFDSQQLLREVQSAVQQSHVPHSPATNTADQSWRKAVICKSPAMEELLNQAAKIAQSEVSILIQGASGTGKELLAKAIHKASQRRERRFVPINCAAIPDNLLESELFGHSKGAFTGADKQHTGLIEHADGGTLFLDEIGDMPLEFQAKLLRVLEEREVRPVGSSKIIPVDIRLISATHVNLEKAVEQKTFREDLYYRLNVMVLEIPPLSERREDIPLLAKHFLSNIQANSKHCSAKSFAPEAISHMMSAPWPGNIRQLLNVVEQVAVLSTTPVIPEQLVVRALRGKTGEIPTLATASSEFEREYLIRILQITEGNVTRAAKLAKRNRTEFYKLLKRHQLEASIFRHH
ncbi:MAG: sigma 54-interacting transcriptional regulator [Gammaproteobacteria bacterium]|nr:sigma 54-interacting transcriptional regulator [Gammaproteobacteria bacterium]